MTALRFLHTVRHLKPVQIYGRVLMRLHRPQIDTSPAPRLRQARGQWAQPVARPASLSGRWRVRFLNEDGDISGPQQWNDTAKAKLWLYNLHYFDDLAAEADEAHLGLQREFISRWITENPPGHGNGWEPYPLSLRIVNWIKWALAGNTLAPEWVQSLAVQTRWLTQRIEWHLLGNHLLANAKALVMAGLFFDGPEAQRWLHQGLSIYERELDEQILADGGHFELSPMYHAIILEDLLDVLNAARAYGKESEHVIAALPPVTARMRAWLAAMTHPDGGPAFFNDAAFGIAASRDELETYAGRLGLPPVPEPGEGVHHLSASGYVRVNRGDMAAIIDLAAVGPDYVPGHAHADTLSFELSLGIERLIVNSGTSVYGSGPMRQAQRSTRAHSTVEIAGQDSSEVWSGFRVARRARVSDVRVEEGDPASIVSASHNGYGRLAGSPVHHREWRFGAASVSISDSVSSGATPAIAHFHLAPGVRIEIGDSCMSGLCVMPHGRAVAWATTTPARIVTSTFYPEFGKSLPTSALAVPLIEEHLKMQFDWSSDAHSVSD